MRADRADLGRLFAHNDMTAVAAFPHLDLALGKDLLGLHIVQQRTVALLMGLFDRAHHAELRRQLREAFLLRRLGKALVHVGPLVIFAIRRGRQILGGGADAVQLLEPHLSMLLLVIRRFEEQRGDLLKAILLGLGGKIGVLVARLGLACKGLQQILFSLGTLILVRHGENRPFAFS